MGWTGPPLSLSRPDTTTSLFKPPRARAISCSAAPAPSSFAPAPASIQYCEVSVEQAINQLGKVDGVMMGRAAYQEPWRLLAVDAELFGDLTLKEMHLRATGCHRGETPIFHQGSRKSLLGGIALFGHPDRLQSDIDQFDRRSLHLQCIAVKPIVFGVELAAAQSPAAKPADKKDTDCGCESQTPPDVLAIVSGVKKVGQATGKVLCPAAETFTADPASQPAAIEPLTLHFRAVLVEENPAEHGLRVFSREKFFI